jgi:hypothetical protein
VEACLAWCYVLGDNVVRVASSTNCANMQQLRYCLTFALQPYASSVDRVFHVYRWWYAAQRCAELDVFHQRVTLELYRRQELLAYKADLASGAPVSQR